MGKLLKQSDNNNLTYISGVVFKPLVGGTLKGGRHDHIVLSTAVDRAAYF